MAYLVLAYPALNKNDYDLIQAYRKEKDKLYAVVEPHFTIVFPVNDLTKDAFIGEVRAKSRSVKRFDFAIRCATINKDAFSDYFHTFLVPDEGFSHLVKLHDKLYSELLSANLRLDLDYIPHIGVGNTIDQFECKKMVDEWNSRDMLIKGHISQLTVIDYSNNKVTKLEEIALK